MEQDISKTTIIVLLVLTVAISIVGTWTVIDSLGSVKQEESQSPTQNVVVDHHITALDHKEDSGTIKLGLRRG